MMPLAFYTWLYHSVRDTGYVCPLPFVPRLAPMYSYRGIKIRIFHQAVLFCLPPRVVPMVAVDLNESVALGLLLTPLVSFRGLQSCLS